MKYTSRICCKNHSVSVPSDLNQLIATTRNLHTMNPKCICCEDQLLQQVLITWIPTDYSTFIKLLPEKGLPDPISHEVIKGQ